ncbi:UDP-N-acetylmuramoyl-L-alanyl-D-glutamate--2,6-diaminopimelate ligase [Rubrimonas cliftonensis]|uniref:UDP-N-acetylmuramoyl-L-alanyl-D-glutamate--2,6-diaminopimelate ligase n=1 Tax=Rubrimonas cliftonensis TaxID=89524 RepID=A0A1H4B7I6_9RHOB|nr:UDP-N-acetylmuramoylalanyl-D-glutamate--2,6-diaminopimelate ligase [Rubrimonas cliftonensis]
MATLHSLGLCDGLILGPAPDPSAAVAGLCVDSRETKPGFVFAALKGGALDGAEFAQYALRMGAVAVICSLDGALRAREDVGGFPVPFIVDADPRRRLALAAARFFGAQPGTVVAVTGTAGKTSAASFTRQLWAAMGLRAANLGTIGVEGAVTAALAATTPEPISLHRALAAMAAEGVTHCAMEASSHGLAQRRLDGVRLAAGAFLNLGRDHLDYHPDMADYASAKLRLFAEVLPAGAAAVINADSPLAPVAAQIAAARGLRAIRVGTAEGAELRLLDASFHAEGQTARFSWEGREHSVELPLIGGFQGANALAAAALAIGAGSEAGAVFAALPRLVGVRGRMEHVATRANGARIYVDYAHKPDALAAALDALRLHTPGRLIVAFGAGGDRDAGKRPLMGAAAAARADVVIVTDDNPRSEDPAAIRAAVLAGCGGDGRAEEVGDRAEAILRGVDALGPRDRLLIAGKGHETGQIVGREVTPFDDAEAARAAVAALDGLDADIESDLDGEDAP